MYTYMYICRILFFLPNSFYFFSIMKHKDYLIERRNMTFQFPRMDKEINEVKKYENIFEKIHIRRTKALECFSARGIRKYFAHMLK